MATRGGGSRTRDHALSALLLHAIALVLGPAGCKSNKPLLGQPTSSGAEAGAVRAKPSLLVLDVDEEALRQAAWTPSGEVVAVSDHRVWRFSPDREKIAKTIPIPGERLKLAAARAADVAIVTSDGTARVLRAGALASTFPIDPDGAADAISDDGKLFLASSRSGTRVYDVTAGTMLAMLPDVGPLSPGDGRYVITESGVRSTRTGELVVALTPRVFARHVDGADWVGSRAVVWTAEGLTIVDPERGDTKRVGAACAEDASDYVDVVRERAVRVCASRLWVATLDDRPPTSIAFRSRKNIGRPSVAFAEDSAGLFLEWPSDPSITLEPEKGPTLEEVDVGKRSVRITTTAPRVRRADGAVVVDEAVARPNATGTLLLRVHGGALVVTDRASGRERTRWGMPDAAPTKSALTAFLHDGGIEIAAELEAPSVPRGIATMRLGPPRSSPFQPPFLSAQPPCSDSELSARYVNGSETLFIYPWGGCVCTSAKCESTELSPWLRTRAAERSILYRPDTNVLSVIDNGDAKEAPLRGIVMATTFTDDGIAALVLGDALEKHVALVELSLPSLATARTRSLPYDLAESARPSQLLATKKSLVVIKASNGRLHADVLARAADAATLATVIDASLGSARVRLPDGRVELLGAGIEDSLVCLASDGTARGFTTCRAEYEAKGAFRIE